jgi:hypothetical protein
MTALTTFGRIGRRYPAPLRPAGTDGASALPPAAERRVREAIRSYGYARGWDAGGVWGSFLSGLCGETAEMRRKYPEMFFREGSIKSPVLSAIWSVASLDLQVLPADKKNQRDRDIAETYRYALLHSAGGLKQIVSEIVLAARVRGESLCHMSLRERLEDRGKYRGKRLIHAVKCKPPSSYQLHHDPYGNLDAVKEAAGGREYVGDELAEFIHYKWLSLEGGGGVSDLRAAVGAFEAKDAVSKLRGFFLDKLAGGFLIVTGVTDTNREVVKAALAEGRGCGFLTLDPNLDAKAIDLAMGGDAAFKSAIEDYDREMMIAVGGAHLPFQEGQGQNNPGNSETQRRSSSQIEWAMAADVGYILTEKARVFVNENYAGADYPEAQLGGGVDAAVTKAQVEVAALVNTMTDVSAEYLHEISSVPPPKDDADRVPARPAGGAAAPAAGALPFADRAAGGEQWVWEEDLAGVEGAAHG